MLAILIIIMFGCLLLGFPMFMSMILSSTVAILVYLPMMQPSTIIQQLMSGIDSFALLAIPLFIFAADIMSAGHTAKRLIDFVKSFIGHIYGGLGVTLAGTCTLFGAISGSSQATVVAIGKTLRPQMLESKYIESDVNGLIVSAANIAALIPPSVTMIMYCVVTGSSVGEMFVAGIAPGVLLFIVFSLYQYFHAKKFNIPRERKATLNEKVKAFKKAILPLGFPIIIVGSIYSGIASPTEAAAISVLYAGLLEMVVYRTISIKDLGKIALSTGAVTAALFILLASGQIFSLVLTYANVPQLIAESVLGNDPSMTVVLVWVTVFFFIAGMFVDPLIAVVVVTPIFYGPAIAAGIDPIWLGIIITVQCILGAISPPFGCNIFTACAAFDVSYTKVVKGLPPYLFIMVGLSIVLIFFPQVITFYRLF
ncbi:MAG: TRAP transporter large permease [Peptostreptococcaceae bacterium]|nr:TRAP transporter large permease [Peptostreptococcaceae bacterium]